MGFRVSMQRSMLMRRSFASSSAASKAAAYNKFAMTGEFAPVYVVIGMVVVAVSIGVHTAKQQLVHAPSVNITKKRRESVPEVDTPDTVVSNGDKFINKSFLRKVAHIQQQQDDHNTAAPRSNPFTRSRSSENLRTVGVNPRGH